jgi:hypothetical protein
MDGTFSGRRGRTSRPLFDCFVSGEAVTDPRSSEIQGALDRARAVHVAEIAH